MEAYKKRKTCIAWLVSVMVSVSGGMLLGWWEYQHHRTNSQLWMVPLGLILFLTQLIASLSLVFSHLCNLHPQHRHSASASMEQDQHIQVSLVQRKDVGEVTETSCNTHDIADSNPCIS